MDIMLMSYTFAVTCKQPDMLALLRLNIASYV